MEVGIFKGTSFISRAIQWCTRSPFSHVAWIFDERAQDRAIHMVHQGIALGRLEFFSVGSCVEAIERGVHNSPSINEHHNPGTVVDILGFDEPLSVSQEGALILRLAEEIGTPYSYRTIIRFYILRLPPRDPRNLICSMLVARDCRRIGVPLFARTDDYRVTPDFVYRAPRLRYLRTVTTI